jgi:hypothetical protein
MPQRLGVIAVGIDMKQQRMKKQPPQFIEIDFREYLK